MSASAPAELLAALAAVMKVHGWGWYVFGAQAVVAYGLFLERARSLDLGGVKVPVISPEDLLVTKVLAGRPKDREDIIGMLAERRGELDLDQVREMLAAVEVALGQSDLCPAFEELMASTKGNRGSKRRPARR